MREAIMKSQKNMHQEAASFREIFDLNIKDFYRQDLVGLITGFDIIKFDETIKTPDGISTRDFINKKYGKKGVELIERLL